MYINNYLTKENKMCTRNNVESYHSLILRLTGITVTVLIYESDQHKYSACYVHA